jgi:Spx/MgsR family transcriptional regulator
MSAQAVLYGIKNCDTVRKARQWLEGHGIAYVFHDYRVDGMAAVPLDRWADALGWDVLLNRASTTFRALEAADKADLNRTRGIEQMKANPTLIKRPVLEWAGHLQVGFKPDQYAGLFE